MAEELSPEAIEFHAADMAYKIWKKNTPFMYDMINTHLLEWTSLTIQWMPDTNKPPDSKDYTVQRLLHGTVTLDSQNYFAISSVQLPTEEAEIVLEYVDNDEKDQCGGFGRNASKIEIEKKIYVDKLVFRARYMPQNPNLIACKINEHNLLIFDIDKADAVGKECKPELRLSGHQGCGFGLSWNPNFQGHLLSSADDKLICMWDINAATQDQSTLDAYSTYTGHSATIEDVAWHSFNENLFGSVGQDKKLMIWDTRKSDTSTAAHTVEAHAAEVNCLDFNPYSEHLLATGSSDQTVALWDLRYLKCKLHSLIGHRNDIFQVNWSPHLESVLASSGSDCRVHIWDLAKIDEQQTAEDAEDGVPELLFIHAGHIEKICDFSWNSNEIWNICSVSEESVLQVWQMAEYIYEEDETQVSLQGLTIDEGN